MNQGEQLKIPYEGLKAIQEIKQDIKSVRQNELNILQECNQNIDALTEELCQSCKDKMYKDTQLSQYVSQIRNSVLKSELYKNNIIAILSKIEDFLESLESLNREQQDFYDSGELTEREISLKGTISQYLDNLFLNSLENTQLIKSELQQKYENEKKQCVEKLSADIKKEEKIYIIYFKMLVKQKQSTIEKYIQEIEQLKQEKLDLQFNNSQKILNITNSKVVQLQSELEQMKNLQLQEKMTMNQEISKLKSTIETERNAIKTFFGNHLKGF